MYEPGLLCTFEILWGATVIKKEESDHLNMSVHVYYSTVFIVYVVSVCMCVCIRWLVEITSASSVQKYCTSQNLTQIRFCED